MSSPEPETGGGQRASPVQAGAFTKTDFPPLVNGLTAEEIKKMAEKELAGKIPATEDGTYRCKYCNITLSNKKSYQQHLKRHAGMLNFKCTYCSKTFLSSTELNSQSTPAAIFSPQSSVISTKKSSIHQ